jgi:tetratricopeptide (TPR) repeat protein
VAAVALLVAACAGPLRRDPHAPFVGLPAQVELSATPFFPQTDYQCGPAALATLLGAAGTTVAPAALVSEIYLPGRRGSLQPEILGALRARNFLPYVIAPEPHALLAEVAAGRPVLVLQRQGLGPWPAWHYAVVVGYDDTTGTLTLRSGIDARRSLSMREFLLTWDRAERWGVIALPPGELPAQPDYARYMQAAAGLEAVGASHDAAHRAYVTASTAWPGEPLPWLGLGNLAASAGDWSSAEHSFREALRRDPQSLPAQNNLGEALRQLGCPHAALAVIRAPVTPAAGDDDPATRTAMRDTASEINADLARPGAPAIDPPACANVGARGVGP